MARTKLTATACAGLAGIRVNTWHAYVARGAAPKPDEHVGRTPLWWESTYARWASTRPGKGVRPDAKVRQIREHAESKQVRRGRGTR